MLIGNQYQENQTVHTVLRLRLRCSESLFIEVNVTYTIDNQFKSTNDVINGIEPVLTLPSSNIIFALMEDANNLFIGFSYRLFKHI